VALSWADLAITAGRSSLAIPRVRHNIISKT
jgi:hypothetical protein